MKRNEKNYSNLLNTIVTLEDSTLLQEELRLLSESLYGGKDTNFETVIAQKVRRSVAVALKADLKTVGGASLEFIQDTMSFFNALPVLEIGLGYEPTAEEIVLFAQKARELAGYPLVLSLMYKPYLIGGAELTINGEYRDYSLRAKTILLYHEMTNATANKQEKVKKETLPGA